ncbi:MAG: S-methyl-5-thioribose-1-phosphate isomerase [Myxococcota bacterium]
MRSLEFTGETIRVIDQRRLPHELVRVELRSAKEAAIAIKEMWVRGAPLIGATAAFGFTFALREDGSSGAVDRAHALLLETRPTAVNLRWALDRIRDAVLDLAPEQRAGKAEDIARSIVDEEAAMCRAIGEHGLKLIEERHRSTGKTVNVLTHCNAGWLATFDYGTATAPAYLAHEQGIPVHVWVDETRPRNQGASLTTWELEKRGVAHTLVADNAGGHLMQHGQVDMCFVGADRVTRTGDACNKIGTYLKALAAHDNAVPFFVCLPSSTIDWQIRDGLSEIPIEERSPREVTHMRGRDETGRVVEVNIAPEGVRVSNPAFDVTPARMVTALITERGVCEASESGLLGLYPDQK